MTTVHQRRPPHQSGQFARARAASSQAEAELRRRAARTVAGSALDEADRRELLSMLGLGEPEERVAAERPTLTRALPQYVGAVAALLGVPPEATSFEITDTATAYLALTPRCPGRDDRDLMLTWSERDGWIVAEETTPIEEPVVVACFGGDLVPHPALVARFVTDVLLGVGGRAGAGQAVAPGSRARLATHMAAHVSS